MQPAATQAPPEHACPVAQRAPQTPQFATVLVGTSQPSEVLALQSAKPALQVMPQPDPAQRPVALAAPTQVVVVTLPPSALHRLRVVAEAHVAVPGVQIIAPLHTPPEHAWPAAQGVAVWPRPSALHTWRAVEVTHEASSGVHTHATQAPARQLWRAPQEELTYPLPPALHVRRPVAPTHSTAPGVHTRATQTPAPQVLPAAQATSVQARPRASQVRARVAPTHSAAEGGHAWARQVASDAQP